MADAEELPENAALSRRFWPRRKRWQFLLVLLILLAISSTLTWRSREAIVGNLIESELDRLGIEASYQIDSIGPTRQVLRDFVIGDPRHPDLSIERIEVVPVVGFFGARIGSVTLVRPRLRASYLGGQLSLGGLDPLLAMESGAPPELPVWDINLIDGRARIFTDYGVVGVKAEGQGRLSGGFAGVLAAVSPRLVIDDCVLDQANLVGRISVARGQPSFEGPLVLGAATCDKAGMQLRAIKVAAAITGDRDFAGLGAKLELGSGPVNLAQFRSEGLGGTIDLAWRDGLADARYSLSAQKAEMPGFTMARLQAQGAARLRPKDSRLELDAGIDGKELRLGIAAADTFRDWRTAIAGTLAEPLLVKFSEGLGAALVGSKFNAELKLRQSNDGLTLVIPAARLRDREGESLLAASQIQYGSGGNRETRLAGNFATSGDGLPQIRARMEASEGNATALRLEMAPYRSGTSMLTIPRLTLEQAANGAWLIDGAIEAGGVLPGGSVEALEVPVNGRWSERAGLALWQRCIDIRFARFELAELALSQNKLQLCPGDGEAILRSTASGLALSAQTDAISLSGRLGDSPIEIASSAIRVSSNEGFAASEVEISLGLPEEQSRLALGEVNGEFGAGIGGTVQGIKAGLAAVPLDIRAGAADWTFEEGALYLSGASFELHDRTEVEADPRFHTLVARDAVLQMSDNVITATAAMRNPDSDRVITDIELRHDLGNGTGFAVIAVPALRFDKALQPDQLTILAGGVIALADGVVRGGGRIYWNVDSVTSTGEFSTDDFDFAAAFGPVERVSGTIRFSDLLSLTTDGTQSLKIGSINPGVEVFDGVFDFALRDQTLVSIKGGRWPFFGGTMVLRPTELNLAVSEERSYVIEITGADAAQFIAAMELGNISATGTFDGAVPLIFDEMGNGEIRNGLLISRPLGGNLSYVGELTYEDTGAIANFAFQSLRSLDFSQMMVEMNGPLTGEIITRLLFDGISQGQGSSSNFITRQIAKLPIRFNVNIRAAFYELLTSLRGMYDPAFIRDPRSLGLLETENGQFVRPKPPDQPAIRPRDPATNESSVQTEESESQP